MDVCKTVITHIEITGSYNSIALRQLGHLHNLIESQHNTRLLLVKQEKRIEPLTGDFTFKIQFGDGSVV